MAKAKRILPTIVFGSEDQQLVYSWRYLTLFHFLRDKLRPLTLSQTCYWTPLTLKKQLCVVLNAANNAEVTYEF